MDHFTYTSRNVNEMENGNEDVQWKFFVIDKRVPWKQSTIDLFHYCLNLLSASEKQEMGYRKYIDGIRRGGYDWLVWVLSKLPFILLHFISRVSLSFSNIKYKIKRCYACFSNLLIFFVILIRCVYFLNKYKIYLLEIKYFT